ncbi:hypothetical protein WN944_027053 [Citrus x changshan-huyou]|uniref:Uncharacterized protein n=1 Tax=Citrus x changshan-huyou TaxID=2935761 RepID=A0AAP0LHW7_9ROSI
MNDMPKQICCGSVEKTVTGGANYSNNNQIHSESVERTVTGEDFQENAPSSYHVPNEIST